MVRGVKFNMRACGVRPITMHCVSWPIRADCACQKEELCRKTTRFRQAGHLFLPYLLVKGVNDCLLDNCQVSSLPHDCVA